MGLRDQKLSGRSAGVEVSAMQLFTDREDPQEAFERKLAVIDECRADASGVICYYGIGGVGKTALRTKLCHMINGDPDCQWRLNGPIECDYAVFDFGEDGICRDRRTILSRIREQLEPKGYTFFLFDMALLMHAQKAGIVITNDKSTSLILDKYPFLNSFVTAANAIPVVGALSSLIQAIDQLPGEYRKLEEKNNKKKYEDELRKMNAMEAVEILDNLKRYFIMDMKTNMTGAGKPLVIFLDTYEKYVDTLNSDTLRITDDYWLWKGSESVIRSIPGILWVILGREALSWDQGDEHWKISMPERPLDEMSIEDKERLAEENIEQHLLGDLSEKDATEYMHKAGVKDDDLCHELYEKITKGTPVYIHICIDQYKAISESRKPVPEDFGKDISELITRYLYNMPDHYREMSYFLAVLGSWTDEMVYEIAPKISSLHGFNKARYADYVAHSFVVKKLDGTQYLHEVVKTAYLANAGEEIIREVRECLDEWRLKEMKKDDSVDAAYFVGAYISNLIRMDLSCEQMYDRWETICRGFVTLGRQYDFERLIPIADHLYRYIRERYPDTVMERVINACLAEYLCKYGKIREGESLLRECFPENYEPSDSDDRHVYMMYASVGYVEAYAGHYDAALRYEQKAYDGLSRILGEDHQNTLTILGNLAQTHRILGNFVKAKELNAQVYERCVRVLGEDHSDTISALNNLAISYDDLGEYQKAKELYELTYEKRVKMSGKDHPATMITLGNLATAYGHIGDYAREKEILEQVYETKVKLFGEDHPNTIITLANLAAVCGQLGNDEKARELYEQVYEKRVKVLGEDHPDTISALDDLAITYGDLGDNKKEKELLEQAYEKHKRVLGEDHPDTISALYNLAAAYGKLEEAEKEKELLERVYEKRVRILGEEHPDTISALAGLAISIGDLGDNKKEIELLWQAYEKRVRVLGEDHPDTVSTLYILAYDYEDLGDYKKGIELLWQVYEKYVKVLGEDHADTIEVLESLMISYGEIGDYKKVRELLEQIHEKKARISPTDSFIVS